MPINGSCSCGRVTYSSVADPIFAGICHCAACQKSTGSSYGAVVAVPTASLTVTGTTKRFDDVGDSGKPTHREFCPECGATVTRSADIMEGLTMVGIGTLDDPKSVAPTMQIYCDSALPWAKIADMKEFAKMPG